ncbi:MAG: hypothetical protein OQK73_10645 [Gammaproteobacteria bacterium]|nr:hypothetical protein [Gammaproteobacteria bacterium]
MRIVLMVWVLLLPGFVLADNLYLAINGLSYHFDRTKKYNETNLGYGLEYDFKLDESWIGFAAGGTFRDSNNQDSNYLAAGGKYRVPITSNYANVYLDFGLGGMLMTRYDYHNNDPFFVAGPFLSLGNDYMALNFVYVPNLNPKFDSLVYAQVMFNIIEF